MNITGLSIPAFETLALSPGLIADLRSDHAGETGAVAIYRGMLAVSRDPVIRAFAEDHIEAERRHLAFFADWLPAPHHSLLLPLWRAAGWMLGAGPALFGRQAVFLTVSAVESFVETHYREQIEQLQDEPQFDPLREVLQTFCDEEVHHRDDAKERIEQTSGPLHRAWVWIVGAGSALGVRVARKI